MAKKVKKKEIGLGIKRLLSNIDQKVEESPEQVVKEISNTIAEVPIIHIEVNPFQPRKDFDETALNELAETIKLHGLIQPVTVRRISDKRYQLISGERRWRASKIAGLEEIPAYIRVVEEDQDMLEMAIIENIQREQLNPVEVAVSYKRLIDECNLTHEEVAQRVDKKRNRVTNYLRILKLPVDVQSALKNNLVTMGHAVALAGVNDIILQNAFFKETLNKSLSVRALESLIRASREPKKVPAPKASLPADYMNIQNQLKNYLEAKVELKLKDQRKGKGTITIHFDSNETLNNLLDKLEED